MPLASSPTRKHVLLCHLVAILLITALAGPSGLRAQAGPEPPDPDEVEEARNQALFASHEVLELTLEADFSTMKDEDRNPEEEEERPATMRWVTPGESSDSLEIKIQTRGNFRLDPRNCELPPLRINVKKKETEGTIFDGQDKLKLVVPCKTGQSYWEQYVILEYLAYRTLNILTPVSFQVRLARTTLVDSSGEEDPLTRYTFIIEDDDIMAARNGAGKRDWEKGQLHPALLDARHAVIVDLFQYMIGNTDWSGVEMHNMELIQKPDGTPLTVPFDFDFSGIVDTRYADPDPSLPIRNVRRRLYRGFCPEEVNRARELYQEVFQHFLEKEEEIYELWRSQPQLEEDRRGDNLDYLEDFFETLRDEDRIESRIFGECRSLRRG